MPGPLSCLVVGGPLLPADRGRGIPAAAGLVLATSPICAHESLAWPPRLGSGGPAAGPAPSGVVRAGASAVPLPECLPGRLPLTPAVTFPAPTPRKCCPSVQGSGSGSSSRGQVFVLSLSAQTLRFSIY